MNKSHLQAAMSEAPRLVLPDPGTGAALPSSTDGHLPLVIGAGAETNTLADPVHAGIELTLTVYSIGAGSRVVTAATKIDLTPHTILTFNAVDQVAMLRAVPYAGNSNKARWQVVKLEGAAAS